MGARPLRDDDPVVIDDYRLQGRLGAGGMGVVYLAEGPEGLVAVKRLRQEYADDFAFRERFRREGAALTLVGSEFTARVLEVQVDVPNPYLVMEYVDGPSLSARVAEAGPLPPGQVRALGAGLAAALMAIHRAGIVHRDLKPGNVLLSERGPKVIDFGIAQLADATSLTETGVAVGSPVYMAPEQVAGRPGPPADVFSWALTLVYAATGRLAFGSGVTQAVMFRIMYGEPDLAGVPDDLKPILTAALAKDPARRPAPDQLVAALSENDETTVARRPDEIATTLMAGNWPAPPRAAGRTALLPAHRPNRKRVLAIGGIAAGVVAAGAAVALVLANSGGQSAGSGGPATGSGQPSAASGRPATAVTPSVSAPPGPCTADDIKVAGGDGQKPTITLPDTCTVPTQLVVKDLRTGTGLAAKRGDDITVNYTLMTWSDKLTLDNSYDRGWPLTVTGLGNGGIIAGWEQGLVGIRKGDRRLLVVPPALAYGTNGQSPVKPNETLVFVVDATAVVSN